MSFCKISGKTITNIFSKVRLKICKTDNTVKNDDDILVTKNTSSKTIKIEDHITKPSVFYEDIMSIVRRRL